MEVSRVGQYSVQICSYMLDLSAVGAESLPSIESAAKFLMRIPLCSKNGSILELYRRDMGRAMNSGTARSAGRLSTCANLIQVLAHVHDAERDQMYRAQARGLLESMTKVTTDLVMTPRGAIQSPMACHFPGSTFGEGSDDVIVQIARDAESDQSCAALTGGPAQRARAPA